jgi:flagellar basal-body rod protein FlgB
MDAIRSGPGDDLLLRLLRAAALRSEVIADNLANQNTPGFTRREVRFEELVSAALASGGDADGIAPRVLEDRVTPATTDGNNVTPEVEINALRENRLLQDAYTAILQNRFNVLRAAIDGGR